MNFYPVIIPTLCRYEHFKRCVDSLSRNLHAEKTELIIGLDYPSKEEHQNGYKKICEYISSIKGFKNVVVLKRKENFGAFKNAIDLRNYAFNNYDAYIFSEDDNEFSPCFLDFMNKALNKYKNESSIITVSGYTDTAYEKIKSNGILFTHDNCAWGLGIWKHKDKNIADMLFYNKIWESTFYFWEIFFKTPSIAFMFATMMKKQEKWGDVMRTVRNIHNKTYQVIPYTSLVRNWGYDGSGLHCTGKDESKCKQEILPNHTYNEDFDTEIKNSLPFSTQFFYLLPQNRIKALFNIAKMGLSCLKMRLNIKYNFIRK